MNHCYSPARIKCQDIFIKTAIPRNMDSIENSQPLMPKNLPVFFRDLQSCWGWCLCPQTVLRLKADSSKMRNTYDSIEFTIDGHNINIHWNPTTLGARGCIGWTRFEYCIHLLWCIAQHQNSYFRSLPMPTQDLWGCDKHGTECKHHWHTLEYERLWPALAEFLSHHTVTSKKKWWLDLPGRCLMHPSADLDPVAGASSHKYDGAEVLGQKKVYVPAATHLLRSEALLRGAALLLLCKSH